MCKFRGNSCLLRLAKNQESKESYNQVRPGSFNPLNTANIGKDSLFAQGPCNPLTYKPVPQFIIRVHWRFVHYRFTEVGHCSFQGTQLCVVEVDLTSTFQENFMANPLSIVFCIYSGNTIYNKRYQLPLYLQWKHNIPDTSV